MTARRMTRIRATMGAAAALAGALTALASPLAAQSYRVRLDVRGQSVSFRGLVSDSIPVALIVPAAGGGFETPDGHAVRCGAGEYCFFSRPGDVFRGVPVTTSASAVLWGLGVEGLTVRATGRVVADIGRDEVWPGTDPSVQLLEGYAEYERSSWLARAGRQLLTSRLEPMGFDGAWLRYRWDRASLEVTGYGGWGLGHAAVLPVPSPALNPLDEWRPRDRQIVAGADAAWIWRAIDVRGEYRREIDPRDGYLVSERAGMSVVAMAAPFRVAGGIEHNIAEDHVGSADLSLTYLQPRYSVTGGVRRYRPFFSLWTLWSAFSPVPYHAVSVSGHVRATDRLSLHGRTEQYRYEDAEVSTALVPQLEDRGWRTSAGATATPSPHWTIDANAGIERGPGASARFADGSVSWSPVERYALAVYGGSLARPLELRYYDATSRWIGARAEWQIGLQRRVWGDVALVDDERDRPDASASSLSQVRVRAGVTVSLGTDADRVRLPPARPAGR